MPRLAVLSESLISVTEILLSGIAGEVRKRWCWGYSSRITFDEDCIL